MFGLTALEKLDVSQNCLTTFPPMPCNLKKLYAHENELEEVPRHVDTMTCLVELFLYRNKLTSLCGAMGKLNCLENLMLAGNPLENPPIKVCMDSTAAHVVWQTG